MVDPTVVMQQADLPQREREKIASAADYADQFQLFHWPLEFPSIFHRERPGFDVVVGNPPWRKIKFEMPKFLALHDPGIRGVRNALERDARAEQLFRERPHLREQVELEQARDKLGRQFFKPDNGYTMQGSGDTDLYKLFCERYASLTKTQGRIGVVLPRVAFLNDGSRGFRQWLFTKCNPTRIDTLLNNRSWAFPIHPQFQIALLTAAVGVPIEGTLLLSGPSADEAQFVEASASEGVSVQLDDIALSTTKQEQDAQPSYELPLVQTQRHADILTKLQQGVRFDSIVYPIEEKKSKTGASETSRATPYRELDEKSQKPLFNHPPGPGREATWKGASFGQYDPHGRSPAGYTDWGQAVAFVHAKAKRGKVFKEIFPPDVLNDPGAHPVHHARIAFRDVTNRTNSRTVLACLIPPHTPLTDTAPYLIQRDVPAVVEGLLLGCMNSIPFDWIARRYVESHLKYFILNMLCFPDGRTPTGNALASSPPDSPASTTASPTSPLRPASTTAP